MNAIIVFSCVLATFLLGVVAVNARIETTLEVPTIVQGDVPDPSGYGPDLQNILDDALFIGHGFPFYILRNNEVLVD